MREQKINNNDPYLLEPIDFMRFASFEDCDLSSFLVKVDST